MIQMLTRAAAVLMFASTASLVLGPFVAQANAEQQNGSNPSNRDPTNRTWNNNHPRSGGESGNWVNHNKNSGERSNNLTNPKNWKKGATGIPGSPF